MMGMLENRMLFDFPQMPTRSIDVDITSPEELKAALYGVESEWLIERVAKILGELHQAEKELANIFAEQWKVPSVIALVREVNELQKRVIKEVREV